MVTRSFGKCPCTSAHPARSCTNVLGGLHAAGVGLLAVHHFWLSHGPVSVAAGCVASGADPVVFVAVVAVFSIAVVAVSYSVIYQGSVLVLAELADQLRLQS